MAVSTGKTLKRNLVLAFVIAGVILIGLIWVEGLTQSEPAAPSFYRNSYQVDESIYPTLTAEARDRQPQAENGTPAPVHRKNSQSGHGDGAD